MFCLIYFEVIFHLFPLFVFFYYKNTLKFDKTNFFIAGIIFASFATDLTGFWFAKFRFNTSLVSNSYIIIDRVFNVLVLISYSLISFKIKRLILATTLLISIYQIVSSVFRCIVHNDYINLISGALLCLFSLYTLLKLANKAVSDSSEIDIRLWSVFALFFFMSATLIPDMITNIDDSRDFPIFYQYVRIGVTVGSNVIRDSLFALFFFQAKKMNYDTGK